MQRDNFRKIISYRTRRQTFTYYIMSIRRGNSSENASKQFIFNRVQSFQTLFSDISVDVKST